MRCPFCGALDTRVVDSRLVGDSDQVRRRRECTECEERFTTYESAELNLPRIVKSRGNREPFQIASCMPDFRSHWKNARLASSLLMELWQELNIAAWLPGSVK